MESHNYARVDEYDHIDNLSKIREKYCYRPNIRSVTLFNLNPETNEIVVLGTLYNESNKRNRRDGEDTKANTRTISRLSNLGYYDINKEGKFEGKFYTYLQPCDSREVTKQDKFNVFIIGDFTTDFNTYITNEKGNEIMDSYIDYTMEVSKDDYLSIDEIREMYCWRDDVECVIIQSTGILGMLLNESKDKTSESKNYNDKLVKLFKDKNEFAVANFKNKYFDGCIITFVPLNPSQTKFNVHITGYFTDMKGLYELKNESKSNKED